MKFERVAVVGAGTIGRGWIPLFARAGCQVSVYDAHAETAALALQAAEIALKDLAHYGLVDDPQAALARVSIAATLDEALAGAQFVQESVPENVATKRAALRDIDARAHPDAIVSSSCSSLDPAEIFHDVAHPERCVIAHPFNPPHLMPLVELLPGPKTSETTLNETLKLMKQLGQSPVILRKAVPGYVVNRLQAAVVNEAMSLVAQGVISPSDLDLCMTESLGRRWAFLGPFETMDLNADVGVAGYAARYKDGYAAIGADLVVDQPWTDDALQQVIASRRNIVPVEGLKARREWRDRQLMKMLAERAHAQSDDSQD